MCSDAGHEHLLLAARKIGPERMTTLSSISMRRCTSSTGLTGERERTSCCDKCHWRRRSIIICSYSPTDYTKDARSFTIHFARNAPLHPWRLPFLVPSPHQLARMPPGQQHMPFTFMPAGSMPGPMPGPAYALYSPYGYGHLAMSGVASPNRELTGSCGPKQPVGAGSSSRNAVAGPSASSSDKPKAATASGKGKGARRASTSKATTGANTANRKRASGKKKNPSATPAVESTVTLTNCRSNIVGKRLHPTTQGDDSKQGLS